MADRVVIRSYRRVFEVDRRIYRVDRWALPVPGGVPLRAVGYFAAAVLAVVILGALPLSASSSALLSPPLRYVVLPLAVAVLGTQAAPDGRDGASVRVGLAAVPAGARIGAARARRRARGRAGALGRRAGGPLGRRRPALQRARVRGRRG